MPPLTKETLIKYDSKPATVMLDVYVLVHFGISMVGVFVVLTLRTAVPFYIHTLEALFIILSLNIFAAIYDQRKYSILIEAGRLVVGAALVVTVVHALGATLTPVSMVGILAVMAVSLAWLSFSAARLRQMAARATKQQRASPVRASSSVETRARSAETRSPRRARPAVR
jgi:hypothetical protein